MWHFALMWVWIHDKQFETSVKYLGISSLAAAKKELLCLNVYAQDA